MKDELLGIRWRYWWHWLACGKAPEWLPISRRYLCVGKFHTFIDKEPPR